MKSIMKSTAVVALMFATVASLANGPKKTFGNKNNGVEKHLIDVDLDPVFKKKGAHLFINLLNLDQESVTIKVLDSEGRVVFIETLKGELVIEKAFNFEKALQDNYTIIVVDNKETFKEVVEVK